MRLGGFGNCLGINWFSFVWGIDVYFLVIIFDDVKVWDVVMIFEIKNVRYVYLRVDVFVSIE